MYDVFLQNCIYKTRHTSHTPSLSTMEYYVYKMYTERLLVREKHSYQKNNIEDDQ